MARRTNKTSHFTAEFSALVTSIGECKAKVRPVPSHSCFFLPLSPSSPSASLGTFAIMRVSQRVFRTTIHCDKGRRAS